MSEGFFVSKNNFSTEQEGDIPEPSLIDKKVFSASCTVKTRYGTFEIDIIKNGDCFYETNAYSGQYHHC